ncbi:metal-dependent hydrolase [Anaerolineales bacterium HSG6]|nr:metal-dependent hydrolase [Anaerolineales bacterium HSG6]MDM8531560.1 metal-dependent hydrolase [Anaerolineales bacterium HSG25]
MNIPGHLAVGITQHHLLNFPPDDKKLLTVLLVGSLFPDIADKTIGYILKLMPGGRHCAHNIFSLLASTLIITKLVGNLAGYAWFSGYTGHLLVDSDRFMPWFFPLKAYNFPKGRGISFQADSMIKETLLLVLAVIIFYVNYARRIK